MGFKIERLEKIIEREISTILINSKDERLRFVTVTKVSLTNDCSIATLYYTILGNEEQKETTALMIHGALVFANIFGIITDEEQRNFQNK